jgi:hypothetical protein
MVPPLALSGRPATQSLQLALTPDRILAHVATMFARIASECFAVSLSRLPLVASSSWH